MKFFSRSSRATGPKMRVPRGLRSLSMMTMALVSKRRAEPSGLERLASADADGADNLAFFHGAAGRSFLDVGRDDIADAGEGGFFADDADHGGHAGAGVVGDIETGAELDHGVLSV